MDSAVKTICPRPEFFSALEGRGKCDKLRAPKIEASVLRGTMAIPGHTKSACLLQAWC